jgi:hypothetical protein
MHQTTIRMGPDLWGALEAECSRLGVSVAQYLREAALARLAYTAGHLGDTDYGRAFGADSPDLAPVAAENMPLPVAHAASARDNSTEEMLAATAVSAEANLVWKRAREVRERSVELRRRIKERQP